MADEKPRAERLPSPPSQSDGSEKSRAARHEWQLDDVEILEAGEGGKKPEK